MWKFFFQADVYALFLKGYNTIEQFYLPTESFFPFYYCIRLHVRGVDSVNFIAECAECYLF